MKPNTLVLLAALGLGLGAPAVSQEPTTQETTQEPAAPVLDAELGAEEAGSVTPGASVRANNAATLSLSMGEKPQERSFEEVNFAASGSPQSEVDFRYSADGHLAGTMTSLFDANGRLREQQFADGAGKVLVRALVFKGPKGEQFFVTAASRPTPKSKRLLKLEKSGVLLASYSHDRAGRLVSSRHPVPPGAEGSTVEYFYAASGRPTRKVLQTPRNVTATGLYSAVGKRQSQKISRPGDFSFDINYSYNTRGNLQLMLMRGRKEGAEEAVEVRGDFAYDKAGRIREQAMRSSGQLIVRNTFARDARGEPLSNTMFYYRDGKLQGSGTTSSPDKDTFVSSQSDAEGKMFERKTFKYLKPGQAPVLQREERVQLGGYMRVTTFDEAGKFTGELYLDPDGKPAGGSGNGEGRPKAGAQTP